MYRFFQHVASKASHDTLRSCAGTLTGLLFYKAAAWGTQEVRSLGQPHPQEKQANESKRQSSPSVHST